MKVGKQVNTWIIALVHSQYSTLYARYILSTSKLVESTNIGEYRMCKLVPVITCQFMQEPPRMLTNIWDLPIFKYSLRI